MLAIQKLIFSIRSKHRNLSCRTLHFLEHQKFQICEMNVADKVSAFVDSYRAFVLRDSILPAVIHHYFFAEKNCTRFVYNVQNALNDLFSFVGRCFFCWMICLAVRIQKLCWVQFGCWKLFQTTSLNSELILRWVACCFTKLRLWEKFWNAFCVRCWNFKIIYENYKSNDERTIQNQNIAFEI